MTIKTKYDIGQEVWYKGHEEIFQDEISQIKVNIDCLGEIHIDYELWGDVIKEEHQLFPTKEELLKSL
jgi:hypothetical protein